jgi:hypothetical protein
MIILKLLACGWYWSWYWSLCSHTVLDYELTVLDYEFTVLDYEFTVLDYELRFKQSIIHSATTENVFKS